MKYIESYNKLVRELIYWQVPLEQPYFNEALKKIGMNDQQIKVWSSIKDKYANSDKEIFMFYDTCDRKWTWGDMTFVPNDAIFQGKIDKLSLDIERYNI